MSKPFYDDDNLLTPAQVCKIIGGVASKTLREWNDHHRHRKVVAPILITYRVGAV